MTDPKKTGLPDDAGNGMSDRSGYYDESERNVTSDDATKGTSGGWVPTRNLSNPDAMPEDTLDPDGSGTTFDAGDAIPKR